jgi:FkbM family methyltransferase
MNNAEVKPRGREKLIDIVLTQLRPIQFRGKGMLAELVVPKTGKRDALVFGSRFSLDLSDYIQRHMYAGSFEREESRIVRQMLRSGMTFVDVGANVGYYTALASRLVGPTGSVLAFEPSEYAFPRLSRMIEVNGLTNVRAIKCALADTAGERLLFGAVDEDVYDIHTATMVPNDNSHRAVVRTDTLDHMAEQLNIKQIDFMKIDVDGFEPLVLQGATGLIGEGRISHILFECAEYWFKQMNTSTDEIVEHLRSKGFRNFSRIGRARSSDLATLLVSL